MSVQVVPASGAVACAELVLSAAEPIDCEHNTFGHNGSNDRSNLVRQEPIHRHFRALPYSNDGGVSALLGNQLIINPSGPGVGGLAGTVQQVTVVATP